MLDDDEDDMNYLNDIKDSKFSSLTAIDSLRNYRKSVSRGNSRSNLRINNRNCYDYSHYNSDFSSNKNLSNCDNEKNLCHMQTSDNSIVDNINNNKEDDNKKEENKDYEEMEINDNESKNNNASKIERIKVIPRNEVNSNDNEQFNELFIN